MRVQRFIGPDYIGQDRQRQHIGIARRGDQADGALDPRKVGIGMTRGPQPLEPLLTRRGAALRADVERRSMPRCVWRPVSCF